MIHLLKACESITNLNWIKSRAGVSLKIGIGWNSSAQYGINPKKLRYTDAYLQALLGPMVNHHRQIGTRHAHDGKGPFIKHRYLCFRDGRLRSSFEILEIQGPKFIWAKGELWVRLLKRRWTRIFCPNISPHDSNKDSNLFIGAIFCDAASESLRDSWSNDQSSSKTPVWWGSSVET